jgi:hypothetical protein
MLRRPSAALKKRVAEMVAARRDAAQKPVDMSFMDDICACRSTSARPPVQPQAAHSLRRTGRGTSQWAAVYRRDS